MTPFKQSFIININIAAVFCCAGINAWRRMVQSQSQRSANEQHPSVASKLYAPVSNIDIRRKLLSQADPCTETVISCCNEKRGCCWASRSYCVVRNRRTSCYCMAIPYLEILNFEIWGGRWVWGLWIDVGGGKLYCRVSRRDFLFTCPDNFATGCIV